MEAFLLVFLMILLGNLIGRIEVKGISLGASGILLAALVFGHFGVTAPKEVKDIGLICFITSVGIAAGPVFFQSFRQGALRCIILGPFITALGALSCVFAIRFLGTSKALAVGLLNGALTSTPGLAAAADVLKDPMVSAGYGIAYPFGIIAVVMFMQIMPRMLNIDIRAELNAPASRVSRRPASRVSYRTDSHKDDSTDGTSAGIIVDREGMFAFTAAVVAGLLIGNIKIPLGGGMTFSLGTSGGPLIAGLIIGHIGHVGNISLRPAKDTIVVLRSFGLALFLIGAGTEAGHGFVDVLLKHGIGLFLLGAAFTLIPMIGAYLLARKFFGMTLVETLGTLTGGITNTPALGALIAEAGSDAPAVSYAAAYPAALVSVVIASQLISVLC